MNMTVDERLRFAEELFETEIKKLLVGKGKDYGGEIANSNFYRAANDLGLSPYQIWYVYFHKHLSSLQRFLERGRVESEPIESRVDDLITYLFIFKALLVEARGATKLPPNGKDLSANNAPEVGYFLAPLRENEYEL